MVRGLSVAALILGSFIFPLESGAWAAEKGDLSVSIAVPSVNGKRLISLYKPEAHFHAVVGNPSSLPVRLWSGWCSWGYWNLSFEVLDEKGDVSATVRKKDPGWDKNYPAFCTVDPGGDFVIDVHFDDATWENPPLPEPGKSLAVTLRAVFQIKETEESKEKGVWTGKTVSEPKRCVICR